jgi:hypothetical protein
MYRHRYVIIKASPDAMYRCTHGYRTSASLLVPVRPCMSAIPASLLSLCSSSDETPTIPVHIYMYTRVSHTSHHRHMVITIAPHPTCCCVAVSLQSTIACVPTASMISYHSFQCCNVEQQQGQGQQTDADHCNASDSHEADLNHLIQ